MKARFRLRKELKTDRAATPTPLKLKKRTID
jgi:hypothetical protein